MTPNKAIEVLGKMKSNFEKNKPDWYINSTNEEDKKAFDIRNQEKIDVLQYAISFIKSETRLKHLLTMVEDIEEHISNLITDYDNEVE